jgi:hypothetical protein
MPFGFGDNAISQTEQFRDLVLMHEHLGDLSFAWVGPIVAQSLDEYVGDHFNDGPASLFEPYLPINFHLGEASRLVDACLVQRQEIMALESEAMLSALDICLARETIDHSAAIARTELAATMKQANLTVGPTAELDMKFLLQRGAIDERLKLHNRPGSALNYGERVTFLRKMYTRNVARAWRHCEIVHEHLEYCYGLKVSELDYGPTHEGNRVEYLIDWLDKTLVRLRRGAHSERIQDVILYLCKDNICPDLRRQLASDRDIGSRTFLFELKPEHLSQASVNGEHAPDPARHATRVLAMDAAFICREDQISWTAMFRSLVKNIGKADNGPRDQSTSFGLIAERMRQVRETRTMGLEFLLPQEPGNANQNDDFVKLQNQPVRFGAVPIWDSGAARDRFRPVADNGISDVPPFGVWKMAVNQYVHGPSGLSKFGLPLEDPEGFDVELYAATGTGSATLSGGQRHAARDLGRIADIAIMLRVAVRERSDGMTN